MQSERRPLAFVRSAVNSDTGFTASQREQRASVEETANVASILSRAARTSEWIEATCSG
jgi:hypothetical protein